MGEEDPSIEPSSLEYIEDSYLPPSLDVTPSLDDICEYGYDFMRSVDGDELQGVYDENGAACHWSEETDLYLRSLTLDQILTVPDDLMSDQSEMQSVETEFTPFEESSLIVSSKTSRLKHYLATNKLRFLTRKKIRDVKVTFFDFSKPYLAKISSGDNYKNLLNIGNYGGKLRSEFVVSSIIFPIVKVCKCVIILYLQMDLESCLINRHRDLWDQHQKLTTNLPG
jgi:hypothetical protein